MDSASRKGPRPTNTPRRRKPLRAESPSSTGDAADGALRGLIGYALRRAQLRVFDDFFGQLAGEGMTPARFSALTVIGAHPAISQADLAQSLDIAPSGVVNLVDSLEDAGLVGREPIEQNRRAYALHLTRKGTDRLQKLREMVEQHESRVCDRLSTGERAQLLELLSRVG